MPNKTDLKNKPINDALIYHTKSKFSRYGNNGTPKVLFIFKWLSGSLFFLIFLYVYLNLLIEITFLFLVRRVNPLLSLVGTMPQPFSLTRPQCLNKIFSY